MAILDIAKMGNPVLLTPAEFISDPTAPEIAQLANDMKETLINIGANGIAAPQVHVSKRLVVYRITEQMIPEGSNMKPIDWRVLVNPEVTPLTDEKKPIWERCLSVPGMHGEVPRYTKVRLTAQQLDGSDINIEATGWHASLLQHECDHVDGILYPQRMEDLRLLAFNSELEGSQIFGVKRDPSEFQD